MSEAKHTPGPYTYDKHGNIWGPANPKSKHPKKLTFIAQVVGEGDRAGPRADKDSLDAEGKATTAFIVRACNSHELARELAQAVADQMRDGFSRTEYINNKAADFLAIAKATG